MIANATDRLGNLGTVTLFLATCTRLRSQTQARRRCGDLDALVVSVMPAGLTSELDHRGGSSPTEHVSPPPISLSARHDQLQTEDQNHQGRAHSPMAPALVDDSVAGRRASSPSSSLRPAYPVNRLFSQSSSRHTQLLATSPHTSSKPNRFSDAFAGLGGRARTLSSTSNARRADMVSGDALANSSFGIGELLLDIAQLCYAFPLCVPNGKP